jgi:hypothetical protein
VRNLIHNNPTNQHKIPRDGVEDLETHQGEFSGLLNNDLGLLALDLTNSLQEQARSGMVKIRHAPPRLT